MRSTTFRFISTIATPTLIASAWTGHGLHAESNPGANLPGSCTMLMKLDGTRYVRVGPTAPGTFECDPSSIVSITSTTALAAAKLDVDRISQQLAK